jgi:hypothetical protein
MRRRLVVTVCRHERGTVVLPVERGGRRRRLDADAARRELEALIARRGLGTFVSVREACAGGCASRGPNIGVTMYPVSPAGEPPSHVAVGWKTYVYSIGSLDCLATIIDENRADADRPPRRRRDR